MRYVAVRNLVKVIAPLFDICDAFAFKMDFAACLFHSLSLSGSTVILVGLDYEMKGLGMNTLLYEIGIGRIDHVNYPVSLGVLPF